MRTKVVRKPVRAAAGASEPPKDHPDDIETSEVQRSSQLETADTTSSQQYETVDAADFHHAMTLGQETIPSTGRATRGHTIPSAKLAPPSSYETESGTDTKASSINENATGASLSTATTATTETSILLSPESPDDTLQRQFVVFQQQEAQAFLESKNYATAESSIKAFLDDINTTKSERDYWAIELAEILQLTGRWRDSLEILPQVVDSARNDEGRRLRMTAEARFQIGEHEKAREICQSALLVLEAQRKANLDVKTQFYYSIELMARVARALGRDAEVRFYSSKVVEGYVSPSVLEEQKRQASVSLAQNPRDNSDDAIGKSEAEPVQPKEERAHRYSRDVSTSKEHQGGEYARIHLPSYTTGEEITTDEGREARERKERELGVAIHGLENEFSLTVKRNDVKSAYSYSISGTEKNFMRAFESALVKRNAAMLGVLLSSGPLFSFQRPIRLFGIIKLYSAFHCAVKYNNVDAVTTMIKTGALNVDTGLHKAAEMKSSESPLSIAASYKSNAVAQLLLESGANPMGLQTDLDAPIRAAVKNNNPLLVSLLAAYGADVSVATRSTGPNIKNLTPIAIAAMDGHLEVATALINAGADIMQIPPEGSTYNGTALHMAVGFGRTAMVELLCKQGIDVNKMQKGKTALDWAADSYQASKLDAMVALYRNGGRYSKRRGRFSRGPTEEKLGELAMGSSGS